MAIFQALGKDKEPTQPKTEKERSTTGKVLRYTMLPEILPRIRGLGFHFGHFAYLLALVFNSARLIPNAHPVMNPVNIGRFGVRQVIAMAANNITWSKNNIDQIAIFSAIVIGLLMIVIQAVLIALTAISGTAFAAPPSAESFFETPDPTKDLAFTFLSHVFGDLNNFWDGASTPGSKTVIHEALHAMLSLYSMAMMVIAVIIVLYYVLTVIAEAAQTGTPFGRRFNSIWAPIRLVVALGLLVPLGSGLNSAQYITLWTAKMGSGLASQSWKILSEKIVASPADDFVIQGFDATWMWDTVTSIFLAEVCAKGYNKVNPDSTQIQRVPLKYENATDNSLVYHVTWAPTDLSKVTNECGSLSIKIDNHKETPSTLDPDSIIIPEVVPATDTYQAITETMDTLLDEIDSIAQTYVDYKISVGGSSGTNPSDTVFNQLKTLSETQAQALITRIENLYSDTVETRVDQLVENSVEKGWIFAGLYYINIGRLIQKAEKPKRQLIPLVSLPTNTVKEADDGTPVTRFFGWLVGNANTEVHQALVDASSYLEARRSEIDISEYISDNSITAEGDDFSACKALNLEGIMGTLSCLIYKMIVPEQLIRLRAEPTLDPMTTLVSAGATIVEHSKVVFVVGFVAIAAAKVLEAVSSFIKAIPAAGVLVGLASIAEAAGHLLIFIGLLGFGAGLVLFFLLPLFPFMYFFFAVVGWVMEIFEAVVAMPLWALSHLRIDGDGMPGSAAINGYFLLFSILTRPFLIVIGLLGGFLVFGAGAYLLQNLFDPLLDVTHTGVDGIELLVLTLIYSYICYMLGVSCFKMVDTIPNQILRWIGAGVSTFNDNREDAIGKSENQLLAASVIGSQAVTQMGQAAGGVGTALHKGKQHNQQLRDREASDAAAEASVGRDMRQTDALEKMAGFKGSGFKERAQDARDNKPKKS